MKGLTLYNSKLRSLFKSLGRKLLSLEFIRMVFEVVVGVVDGKVVVIELVLLCVDGEISKSVATSGFDLSSVKASGCSRSMGGGREKGLECEAASMGMHWLIAAECHLLSMP